MEKITVNLCLGTTCFVMGGAKLQELADTLPAKYGDKIEVVGKTCLDLCSSGFSKAPYAKVNDQIIGEATAEKIISAIEEILNPKEDEKVENDEDEE